LREALLRHPERFAQLLAEKLITYGLGRPVEYYDMPAVRSIVRRAAADDYRFSALIQGIVESDAFQQQAAAPPNTLTAQARSQQ
jgi:hypothetical protein